MWMSARRFVVMTRLVRVALGNTNRASSPGMPAATRSPYRPSEPSTCSSYRVAEVGVALGDRRREHRRRALELHVALALLVEGDARAMADELVRQRPRHAGDGEREHDVLDRRAVPGLDDVGDQPLHRGGVDLALGRLAEDLLGLELRVAGPARGVHERHVVAVDDLLVREQEGRLHAELVAPRVLGDRGLRALGCGRLCHARSLPAAGSHGYPELGRDDRAAGQWVSLHSVGRTTALDGSSMRVTSSRVVCSKAVPLARVPESRTSADTR